MAINRTPGSLFDSLKEMSIEGEKNDKKKQPKTTQKKSVKTDPSKPASEEASQFKSTSKASSKQADDKKTVEKNQPKTTSFTANEPISTQKEELVSSFDPKPSIKAFDFGEEKVKKEIKSVRKQFVFTPTYAKWLNDTAKLNNISENLVIERLMERAMKS